MPYAAWPPRSAPPNPPDPLRDIADPSPIQQFSRRVARDVTGRPAAGPGLERGRDRGVTAGRRRHLALCTREADPCADVVLPAPPAGAGGGPRALPRGGRKRPGPLSPALPPP